MSTIIPTTWQLFPECPGYGFSTNPMYLVNLVIRNDGFERADRRWARPLLTFTASPFAARDEATIQAILYFWHAMGGRKGQFIFKDWTDYKSCMTYQTPARTDAPLVARTMSDSSTAYQLQKRYEIFSDDSGFAPVTQLREITKPVASTILIANAAGTNQTDFTIDEEHGLVKPGGSFSGVPTTWGGQFNVPARFNSELNMTIVDKQVQGVSFTVLEKRLALATDFGGSP